MPATTPAVCDCPTAQADTAVGAAWAKGFTRRRFVGGSAALVAALGSQLVTSRYTFAAAAGPDTDTIVVINLRGGWDSLNIVAPITDPLYHAARRSIAVPEGAALPLERGFGLHPVLTGVHALYRAGTMAPVVAVGTPDTTLSHFEAMDTLERGTARGYNGSGWMNRVLQARKQTNVFSAVQLGNQLPLALTGDAPALAMRNLESFALSGYDNAGRAKAEKALARMYAGVKHPMTEQVNDTLAAVAKVRGLSGKNYTPPASAGYPKDSGLARSLGDVARLVRAKVGLSIATLDLGGWDTHTGQGTVGSGDLRDHLVELDACVTAFVRDLGPALADTTIVLMSEFGRTLAENGSVGTDHGHGQAVWVIGGGVKGGKVYGAWPGLAKAALAKNGSLAARTDYRDVLAEVLVRRGGLGSTSAVFPDHKPTLPGLLRPR